MANHDDNARSLLFLDDVPGGDDHMYGALFFGPCHLMGLGNQPHNPFVLSSCSQNMMGLCSGQTTEHMGAQG